MAVVSKAPAPHLALGVAGEEAALKTLLRRGVRLLARNWRPAGAERGLELDIVLMEGDTVVFVEVKTRSHDAAERPVYGAFTGSKSAKMVREARQFLAAHDLWSRPCRFDLVCVRMDPENRAHVECYNNVVELGQTLDNRNAAWQPW